MRRKAELKEELNSVALGYVEQGKPCLAPVLRHLVASVAKSQHLGRRESHRHQQMSQQQQNQNRYLQQQRQLFGNVPGLDAPFLALDAASRNSAVVNEAGLSAAAAAALADVNLPAPRVTGAVFSPRGDLYFFSNFSAPLSEEW